jgi:hypothetical protein
MAFAYTSEFRWLKSRSILIESHFLFLESKSSSNIYITTFLFCHVTEIAYTPPVDAFETTKEKEDSRLGLALRKFIV